MSKEKHDHKITKNLKSILFVILMVLPIIQIILTCYYYTRAYNVEPLEINVMETAINDTINGSLMNWVQNTAIYSTINGLFTGLNVDNNLLINLLTYWLMLTAIYIVFDIIIETFIYITHILEYKI